MKVKYILLLILGFTSFQKATSQELTLHDLKKVALAKSIDQADSVLRIKKYKIDILPEKSDTVLRYVFMKSDLKEKLQMLNLTVNKNLPGINIAQAIYNYDTDFYDIKKDCENQAGILERSEKFENGAYKRIYCDSNFCYIFSIQRDETIEGNMFTITVMWKYLYKE